MINNDKLTEAFNEYEKLKNIAEERDYKHGWIYYKLLEKFGAEIADKVYVPKKYSDLSPGDGWDGFEGD